MARWAAPYRAPTPGSASLTVTPSTATAFQLVSPHEPAGDQPNAIRELTEGLEREDRHQVLLGATGTGKTFSMAHVIANHGRRRS